MAYSIAWLFGLLFLLLGCGQGETQSIMITGSSTVAPLVVELAAQFEEKFPDLRVNVQTGGSTRGIRDAQARIADIGMVSRKLHPEEANQLQAYTVGYDGIVVVTHAQNPIQNMTSQQVVDVYRGKIDRWSSLGGNDTPIIVIHKAEGRSTNELFLAHFSLKNSEVDADVVIGDNQQGIITLISNPQAIAYVSIGAAQYEIDNGAPIKIIKLDDVLPSLDLVKSGSASLYRPLNLVVSSGANDGVTEQFIEYAMSSAAADVVEKYYFVAPDAE